MAAPQDEMKGQECPSSTQSQAPQAPQQAPAQTQTQADADKPPPKVDPHAISALESMGAFLRDQTTFTVKAETQIDQKIGKSQDQVVELESTSVLRARRPDHLRVDIKSDRKTRQLFYDGNELTVYSPKMKFYATVPAPGTIHELVDHVETKYGIEFPFVDLFRWGTEEASTREITAAEYIGTATIDGVTTDQWAFRQPGLDWQIWITRGDQPVPKRLVMINTDDPERPRHSITFTWDLNAQHEDAVFAFEPPKGSHPIEMVELTPTDRSAMKKRPQEKQGE